MKKRSFKDLFAALETEPENKAADGSGNAEPEERGEKNGPSAAERVGRALLDKLGGVTGMDEEELADAIVAMWKQPRGHAESEPEAENAAGLLEGAKPSSPFEAPARTPVPIKSGAIAQAPVDYDELTDAQFSELRRKLKRAAADGKKIKL